MTTDRTKRQQDCPCAHQDGERCYHCGAGWPELPDDVTALKAMIEAEREEYRDDLKDMWVSFTRIGWDRSHEDVIRWCEREFPGISA